MGAGVRAAAARVAAVAKGDRLFHPRTSRCSLFAAAVALFEFTHGIRDTRGLIAHSWTARRMTR